LFPSSQAIFSENLERVNIYCLSRTKNPSYNITINRKTSIYSIYEAWYGSCIFRYYFPGVGKRLLLIKIYLTGFYIRCIRTSTEHNGRLEEGGIMDNMGEKVVVRESKCSLCKHSVFCVIAVLFRTFATCEGVMFREGDCGVDLHEEDE